MTYQETIDYLYAATPSFQKIGAAAYKEDLYNTHKLDVHFGHPHRSYRTIHVAGTNGKGSCAHTLAALLQHRGYKVGLYTSPHLLDFRERIRINGKMIPKEVVIDFVENERAFFEPLAPSFFEITTALAFKYFADEGVDVAVIEVGLGGRLDCTNIISPVLSVITNISLDHTDLLGDTLQQIAIEKAGIIKAGGPIVIGEALAETRPVFERVAREKQAPIYFAEDIPEVLTSSVNEKSGLRQYETRDYGLLEGELVGECQIRNTNTLLCAITHLKGLFDLRSDDIRYAFRHVCDTTGLRGRWQQLGTSPVVVCDTGHNPGGWQYLAKQLYDAVAKYREIHVVFGMVADKDIEQVMSGLPKQGTYYWTKASVRRAISERDLADMGRHYNLRGTYYSTVKEAYNAALHNASQDDFIYVGGSTFVVADLLRTCF